MRRIYGLPFVCGALVVVTSATLSSYGDDWYDSAQNIRWGFTVTNGEATISTPGFWDSNARDNCTGDIVVPSRIGPEGPSGTPTYPVCDMKPGLFRNCVNVRSVTLPDGMRRVADNAFYFDSGSTLTNVVIGAGCLDIGENAFCRCHSLVKVNIPDTVGYTTPAEMRELIEYLRNKVPDSDKAIFSVHCHNDLGLATANSLAGVQGGARQIECTVNGLGERAGNTALEEVVMAMRTRPQIYPYTTGIDTTQISRASRTVYNIIGQSAPLNKPIVGRNAFAHEAGIHQHGVLANKQTYEILTPESLGIQTNNIVLGKHSGKHAVEDRLKELGYTLTKEELLACFEEFKLLCDKKKNITDADLEAIAEHRITAEAVSEEDGYKLDWFSVHTSNFTTATCTVSLERDGEKFEDVCLGDGPIDAAFNAIDKIVNPAEHTFDIYNIHSVSEGKDTLGDVTIKLMSEGKTYTGKGLSTDVIEASITAYIKAVNKLCAATANTVKKED